MTRSCRRSSLQMYARDWVRAGEGAYDAIARRTASPSVMGEMVRAILMHARVTGDTRRARIAVEDLAGVTWDAAGRPASQEGSTGTFFSTLLAVAMLLDGEQERARRLLAETIARTEHEIRDLGRPEHWYRGRYALALALNGDREASIAALQRYANAGAYPFTDWQLLLRTGARHRSDATRPAIPGARAQGAGAPGGRAPRARPDARRRAGARPKQRQLARQLTVLDDHARVVVPGVCSASTAKLQR